LPSRIPAIPPQVYQPVPGSSTNGLAIGSLICGIGQFFGFWLLCTIPAIVLGHLARRQIRQTREQGDGMALAGLVLGYVGVGFTVLLAILLLFVVAAASRSGTTVAPGPGG